MGAARLSGDQGGRVHKNLALRYHQKVQTRYDTVDSGVKGFFSSFMVDTEMVARSSDWQKTVDLTL